MLTFAFSYKNVTSACLGYMCEAASAGAGNHEIEKTTGEKLGPCPVSCWSQQGIYDF